MQHASTRQKGLGDRLEAVQMSPHLRQNLVTGLLYIEQVITDFRASLHWAGDRWGDSASYPCTAIHGVTRFGSSGLAEARLLLVVFQPLWICLVNPIPASTTSVSLFDPVLLPYLSPAIAPSTAACAVPHPPAQVTPLSS